MKKLFVSLWTPWVLGLIIILPAVLPCFHTRLFRVHDFTHVARLAELDRTLAGGIFPPRWSQNLGFGYGMPLFSFYAPLPYYLGIVFHYAGMSYEMAVQALFVVVFYASFMAMYGLAKHFFNTEGSLAAATLFIYGPYRAVDTYVRGALGELYGIMFIVVCLLVTTEFIAAKNKVWISITALAIAGLMLSHNLMALLGLPVVGLWGIWWIWYEKGNSTAYGEFFLSLLLGVGVAGYFFIPALLEKSYTSVGELITGAGSYTQHFVYLRQLINSPFGYGGSIEGMHDGISFEIGKVHLLLTLVATSVAMVIRQKRTKSLYLLLFSALVSAGALFLTNSRSAFLWKLIPLMSYFQFPWRFLSLTLIFVPLIAGFAIHTLTTCYRHRLLLVTTLMLMTVVFYAPLFKPEYYPAANNPIYSTDVTYIQQEMSKVIPDYIHPQLASLVLSSTKDISPPSQRFGILGSDTANLSVIESSPEQFQLKLTGQGLTTVYANIFDFPGWQWWINGTAVAHSVGVQLPIMSVMTPLSPDSPTFIVGRLTETPIRKFSDWLSLVSLGLVVFIGVRYRKTYAC